MKIKKYAEHVNEKVDSYDFEFTTKIDAKQVDITIVNTTADQYVDAGDFSIHWEMDFDNRKSGINSMSPIIMDITGTYTVTTPGEDEDDVKQEEFTYKSAQSDWQAVPEINNAIQFGYAIAPDNIEVDFKSKKITVIFNG
jgi:hypothetical protein